MAKEIEYQTIDLQNLLGRTLNDIEEKFAPEIIYCKGVMDIPLPDARVSIVGTREPTNDGISDAVNIAKILVENNVVIVSGLAKGIDTIGHRTAIKNDGKTIAVIGTPLNTTYPKENIKLQEELMRNHLVVSQFPVGSTTTKKNFVFRNHTMALISDASVIIEAGEGSGTLYQGWETLRLGRPLFICKSAVHNPKLKWPKKMIEYGAMELVDTLDILEHIPSSVKMPKLFE